MAITLARILLEVQKLGFAKEIWPNFLKMT